MEGLILKLKERIQWDKNCNNNANESSWGQEQGVLITQNDAQQIIDSYDHLKAAFEKMVEYKKLILHKNTEHGKDLTFTEIKNIIEKDLLEAGLLIEKGEEG